MSVFKNPIPLLMYVETGSANGLVGVNDIGENKNPSKSGNDIGINKPIIKINLRDECKNFPWLAL